MNTLSKQITATYFFDEEQEKYDEFRKRWSELVNDKEKKYLLTHRMHILYLVLSGKDWRKAVTIATNENKLANGYKPKYAQIDWDSSKRFFKDEIVPLFGDLFTREQIKMAQSLMIVPKKHWENFGKQDAYRDLE